jgi:GT2 family glycosyltransferase/glycosyltransferase involved in cell wall biosynthesis
MTELRSLLANVGFAVEAGDMREALRLVDRASRVSGNPDIVCLLRSRLLIQAGRYDQALRTTADRDAPAILVVRAEAYCRLGALNEARAICGLQLANFCVDAVDGLPQLASQLCRRLSSNSPGWLGVDAACRLVGEARIDAPITTSAGEPSLSWGEAADDGWARFILQPPEGFGGALRVDAAGLPLLGSGLNWPPSFRPTGWVVIDGSEVRGEARLGWAPNEPVQLALTDDRLGAYRVTLPPPDSGDGSTTFSVPLSWVSKGATTLSVSIVLPTGALSPLSGSPARLRDRAPAAKGLAQARSESRRKRVDGTVGRVDVVVPVYAGYDETMACLASVLATTTRAEAEIVVVDDASPEPRLADALAALDRDGRISLLTHQTNQGFPTAANRGMALHPDRDVVILNADAEVYGDWLRRLKQAAYSADDIASVTPFGNAGSITNYPGRTDRPCSTQEAAAFDAAARAVNAGKVAELPVGVGFCLYLRRACLDDVGLFDAVAFGRGYGEENDLCLRASKRGWRHVVAPNVFVRHVGGRSFGDEKAPLMARNRRVLNNRHPEFEAAVGRFIDADPLRELRRSIDAEHLLRQSQHPVVILTTALPGGVARSVEDRRREFAAAGCETLVVRPASHEDGDQRVALDYSSGCFENLIYELPTELDTVLELLGALHPIKIEVHHFLGHDPTLLEQLVKPPTDYDVYVHDYSWICPRLTLLGGDGHYCGEPPVEHCEACVKDHGSMLSEAISVAALRQRSARLFAGAKHIFAPSEDCRTRLKRYFQDARITVRPLEPPAAVRSAPRTVGWSHVRIGVIGALSQQKGYSVLLDCARHALTHALPLEFVLVGYSSDDKTLIDNGKIFVTGRYSDDELEDLLDCEDCDAFFFPSVTPETWCYTLTAALSRGAPVVAFDIGAIAERLRANGVGVLLPLRASAENINTTLLKVAQQQSDSSVQNPASDFKPALPEESIMDQTSETEQSALESSAQLLPLPAGLYAFKVSGATDPPPGDLLAPAVQVGVAPVRRPGAVEFLTSPSVSGGWLSRKGETIVVKIGAGGATLLLTSLRRADGPGLAIDAHRVDDDEGQEAPSGASENPTGQDAGVQVEAAGDPAAIPVRILAHVRGQGDVAFLDQGWAGVIGQEAWIEAFSVLPEQGFANGRLEYSAVGLNGGETAWVGEGEVCGSRGEHEPLVAFAFRLAETDGGAFECRYRGRFISGVEVGPVSNAEPCRSPSPDDPLEALMVWIVEQPSPMETQAALEEQRRNAAP